MSEKMDMSRRKFLVLLLGTAGVSFAGGIWLRSTRLGNTLEKLDEGYAEADYREIFGGIEKQMALIGERVVNEHYGDVTKEELIPELNAALASQDFTETVLSDLSGRLRNRVLEDFRNDRLLLVNKWMLTETEARLAAWFYL